MAGLIDSFWTKTNELASSALSKIPVPGVKSLFGKKDKVASADEAGGSTDPHLQNRKYTVRIYQNKTVVVGAVPESLEINQAATWSAPWAGGIGGNKGDLMALGLGTRLVAQVLTLQVWQGGGNNDFDFTLQFEFRAYANPERDVMIPLRALLAMSMPSLNQNGFLKAPGPQLSKEGLKQLGAGAGAVIIKTGEVVGKVGSAALSGKMVKGEDSALAEADKGVDDIGRTAQANGFTRKAIESNMENKIKIEVGDWFRLTNVIITDVRHTLKAQRPGPEGTLMAADVSISFRPMFTLTAEDIPKLLGKFSEEEA